MNTTTPHFAQAVDLVTGWMLGAKITYPEYTREYQVVQRELERNKGNPDMVFWQLTQENRYKVSPAQVPVIGYQEVIQGLSRDDVYSYYKKAYQPNNMVFAVAANMDPEEMLKVMRQNLADAKPGRAFSHDIAAEPPVLGPRTVVATFPKLGQARLNLAFPSVEQIRSGYVCAGFAGDDSGRRGEFDIGGGCAGFDSNCAAGLFARMIRRRM